MMKVFLTVLFFLFLLYQFYYHVIKPKQDARRRSLNLDWDASDWYSLILKMTKGCRHIEHMSVISKMILLFNEIFTDVHPIPHEIRNNMVDQLWRAHDEKKSELKALELKHSNTPVVNSLWIPGI